MNPNKNLALIALFFLVFTFSSTTPSKALDILKQLQGYDDYGAFIDVINKTKLYEKINTRNTVTVLILSNSSMSAIAGRSDEEKEKIVTTHILLDYFDKLKLSKIKSVSITNLYQSSGVANDEQGFVNITRLPSGSIAFGSAVKGSPLVAKLVKEVLTKPYNLSVLEVSLPIVAPGIGKEILPPPPPPFTPPPAGSPKKSKGGDDEETVVDDADSPSDSPAESPKSESPAPSPSVEADAPGPSDQKEDAADDKPSSGSQLFVGGVMLMGLLGNLL